MRTFDPVTLDADKAFVGATIYDGVKIIGFGEDDNAMLLGWHDLDKVKRVYQEWLLSCTCDEMSLEEVEVLEIKREKVWVTEHVPDQCEVWEWADLDADDRALRLEDGEEAPTSCFCDEWNWWASAHSADATGTDLIEVTTVRVP